MKKTLLAVVALAAISLAFVGCPNLNDGPKHMNATWTSKDNIVLEQSHPWVGGNQKTDITTAYQVSIPLPAKWTLIEGDVIKVTVSAKSDVAFKLANANIVDQSEAAGWWKVLNAAENDDKTQDRVFAGSVAEDASAITDIEAVVSEYKILRGQDGTSPANLVVYIDVKNFGADVGDLDDNNAIKNEVANEKIGEKVTLSDVTLEVVLNEGGEEEAKVPVTQPSVQSVSTVILQKQESGTAQTCLRWLADDNAYEPAIGDKVIVSMTVTSPIDIAEFKASLIDNSEAGGYWTALESSWPSFGTLEKDTATDVTATMTLTALPANKTADAFTILLLDPATDHDGDVTLQISNLAVTVSR